MLWNGKTADNTAIIGTNNAIIGINNAIIDMEKFWSFEYQNGKTTDNHNLEHQISNPREIWFLQGFS